MLIVIDVGNTNIVAGIYNHDKLIDNFRINTYLKDYGIIFSKLVKTKKQDIEGIAISSVVPSLNKTLGKVILDRFNIKPFFINHKVNLGIKVDVDNPSEVGADRIVNSVAAKAIYKSPAIVIDFGTATTLDVVSMEGNYIGGIITPGINMGVKSLFKGTAKLPIVKIDKPKNIIGRNTIDCINSGLVYGTIGSIEYFVKIIRKELKCKAKVIGTGGLVDFIASKTDIIDYTNKFLTLHGIKLVYELNK